MSLFFLSFFAGIISFLSPCVLPLIPGYLSFICGTDLENLQKKSRYFILQRSVLFVLGFSFVFILLGASSTLFGSFLLSKSQIFSNIIAIIIIFFGLYLTGIVNFNFLNNEFKFYISKYSNNFYFPFIVGMGFAFGWTPLHWTNSWINFGIGIFRNYSCARNFSFNHILFWTWHSFCSVRLLYGKFFNFL